MSNNPVKTISMVPVSVRLRDGDSEVSLSQVFDKFRKTIEIVEILTGWGLKSNSGNWDYYTKISNGINPDTGEELPPKTIAAGHYLKHNFIGFLPEEMLGKSRVERLIRHNLVTDERGLGGKYLAKQTDSYTKNKRTINLSPPTPSQVLEITMLDSQYATIERMGDRLELTVITYDIWVVLTFKLPKHYRKQEFLKIGKPKIILTKKGNIEFKFPAEMERLYPKITSKYVIGVDLGVKYPYVATVVDTEAGEPIETVYPSQKIMSLNRDIKITAQQIKNLHQKIDKHLKNPQIPLSQKIRTYQKLTKEIKEERAGLTRKRRAIAILIGQEIVNISVKNNNTVIAVEELGWIKNTMSVGRWNRGEQKHWIKHYANLTGTLVYEINPYNTSQECWKCETKGYNTTARMFTCKTCKTKTDRDVNASINIGKKAIERTIKTAKTREKTRQKHGLTQQETQTVIKQKTRIPKRRETPKNPLPKQKIKPSPCGKRTVGNINYIVRLDSEKRLINKPKKSEKTRKSWDY